MLVLSFSFLGQGSYFFFFSSILLVCCWLAFNQPPLELTI
jgi:hypothetical protein